MDLSTTVKVQTDIDIKIQNLSEEKRTEFYNELFENLNDDGDWCIKYGLRYSNPDMTKAKECLFKEKYAKYISA
jgi:hypothetical protein